MSPLRSELGGARRAEKKSIGESELTFRVRPGCGVAASIAWRAARKPEKYDDRPFLLGDGDNGCHNDGRGEMKSILSFQTLTAIVMDAMFSSRRNWAASSSKSKSHG